MAVVRAQHMLSLQVRHFVLVSPLMLSSNQQTKARCDEDVRERFRFRHESESSDIKVYFLNAGYNSGY